MVERLKDDILERLLSHKRFYVVYMAGLTQYQKMMFRLMLRKCIRQSIIPLQEGFYLALAYHFLDDNNQYKPEVIGTPLYMWCREVLFGKHSLHMFFYLAKIKRDNPTFGVKHD